MKKRRIAIFSFLLVAVLAIGVGFAAIADTLNISGRASFRPATVVNNEIAAAISFDEAFNEIKYDHDLGENIISTFVADTESSNAAAMTVTFNGVAGVTKYMATAIYKVDYQDGANLPDVEIEAVSTLKDGESNVDGLTISTALVKSDDVVDSYDDVSASAGNKITFTPGETVYVVVTVTYDMDTVASPAQNVVSGVIAVALHCEAVGTEAEAPEIG